MLPAATPPNAIAYASGGVTVTDMAKSGSIANVLGMVHYFQHYKWLSNTFATMIQAFV